MDNTQDSVSKEAQVILVSPTSHLCPRTPIPDPVSTPETNRRTSNPRSGSHWQLRTRSNKGKGDHIYIFSNKTKSEILAANGYKDVPGAHLLLAQFGLDSKGPKRRNIYSHNIRGTLSPLRSEILKALYVVLDNAIQTQAQEALAPDTHAHTKLEELIQRQETEGEKLTRLTDEIKACIDLSSDALERER